MDNRSNASDSHLPLYSGFDAADWVIFTFIVALWLVAVYAYFAITSYVLLSCCLENRPGVRRKVAPQGTSCDSAQDSSRGDGLNGSLGKRREAPLVKKPGNKLVKQYRVAMLAICKVCALLCVAHFVLEQYMFLAAGDFSSTLVLTNKYLYGCLVVFGYVFFWFRQRALYNHASSLRHLYRNRFLRACSSLSLVFVLVNVVTQLALLWFLHARVDDVLYEALAWLIGCTLVQGSLLILFVYPVYKLDKSRRQFFKSNTLTSRLSSPTGANSVTSLVRKSLALACAHFFTDFANALLMLANSRIRNARLSFVSVLFADFNCVLAVYALVWCFGNWRVILFPWKRCCAREDGRIQVDI